MIDNDLIVLGDFDPRKRIEEYVFDSVSIWICFFRLC